MHPVKTNNRMIIDNFVDRQVMWLWDCVCHWLIVIDNEAGMLVAIRLFLII